jgi:hypothetical protein
MAPEAMKEAGDREETRGVEAMVGIVPQHRVFLNSKRQRIGARCLRRERFFTWFFAMFF